MNYVKKHMIIDGNVISKSDYQSFEFLNSLSDYEMLESPFETAW